MLNFLLYICSILSDRNMEYLRTSLLKLKAKCGGWDVPRNQKKSTRSSTERKEVRQKGLK
jgi:hypothetical protein